MYLEFQQQLLQQYLNNMTTIGTKTQVIHPGETIVLPKDAVVQSIIIDGAINVTSECDLPSPSSYKCGYFFLILDHDSSEFHSMEETQTFYLRLKVADNIYEINESVIDVSTGFPAGYNGATTSQAILNTHIPDQALFTFKNVVRTNIHNRQEIRVYFKTPEPLFNQVELTVDNYGSVQYYRPWEEDCDNYPGG